MRGNGKQPVKLVRLTLQEKLKVIDVVNSGKSHAEVSEKFNALQSSVTQIMNDKDSIHQALKVKKKLKKERC